MTSIVLYTPFISFVTYFPCTFSAALLMYSLRIRQLLCQIPPSPRRCLRLPRQMQYIVHVLDKALLVLALRVDGRRGRRISLLARCGEESTADGYGEGCDCELFT